MCTGMLFKCISHIGLQPKKLENTFFQKMNCKPGAELGSYFSLLSPVVW